MFRVTLICSGLPASVCEETALNIAKKFAEHRKWHTHVMCEWDGTQLVLRSENDFDETGEATLHEFGDCISAYIAEPGDYQIHIASVSEFDHDNA